MGTEWGQKKGKVNFQSTFVNINMLQELWLHNYVIYIYIYMNPTIYILNTPKLATCYITMYVFSCVKCRIYVLKKVNESYFMELL